MLLLSLMSEKNKHPPRIRNPSKFYSIDADPKIMLSTPLMMQSMHMTNNAKVYFNKNIYIITNVNRLNF